MSFPSPFPSGLAVAPPAGKNRSPEVDLIRVLSASLLFYFHTGIVTQWFHYQWAGYVTGTFIPVTTYCALKWSRHRHQLIHHGFSGAKAFIAARFWGLYPVYVFFCLLIFAGSHLYLPDGHKAPFSLGELGLSLLMANQYAGLEYFTDPMWFVPFVLQVYLLVPLLCRFSRYPILGMAGCTLFSFLLSLGVSQLVSPERTGHICSAWSPLLRLPLVFLGVVFATAPWRQALAAFGVFAAGIIIGLYLVPVLPGLQYVLLKRFYGLNAMLAILAMALVLGRLMRATLTRWDWLAVLGQAAVPFFLSHCVLIRFVHKRFGADPVVWIAYFAACWIGSILFIHVWKLARRWIARKGPAARGAHKVPATVATSAGTTVEVPALALPTAWTGASPRDEGRLRGRQEQAEGTD